MQAGDGGRLYKGIFGTRCEATICVKVQLSDTQIRIGKRQGFHKESSFWEQEQIGSMGTKRIDVREEERMRRTEGQEERQGGVGVGGALNEKKRKPSNETVSQRQCKWMHSNEEWHQKRHNELRLLDLRGVQSSGGYTEGVCALCLHILLLREDAAACPCVTHRNSCPPYSGGPLCLLYVYGGK